MQPKASNLVGLVVAEMPLGGNNRDFCAENLLMAACTAGRARYGVVDLKEVRGPCDVAFWRLD